MILAAVSVVIFAATLYLVFSEKVERTIAALAGAVAMVAAGRALGFYDEEQALAAIDFNTLGLLFGMMMLVALLQPTGFFEYLAVWAARLSRGRPVRLLILLASVTTVLSMFLDNVTTVVLIAPVTVLISEILGISAMPLLVAEALLSNAGGVATLIGDPPNIVIASAAGFSFNDFLIHTFPVVVVVWFVALGMLRYLFRRELAHAPGDPEAVMRLKPKDALNDRVTIRRVLIVLGGTFLLFFLHTAFRLSPSLIAMTAAAVALAWTRPQIARVLEHIEWDVLVFFAGLFVMVGGLDAAGVLSALSTLLTGAQGISPLLFGIALMWASAALATVIGNVPITIALVPVIRGLESAGMNVVPLWWALAFGAGFGALGTIIGSGANVVVASISKRTREPITSALWSKRGLPVMVVTLAVASLLYTLAFPLFAS